MILKNLTVVKDYQALFIWITLLCFTCSLMPIRVSANLNASTAIPVESTTSVDETFTTSDGNDPFATDDYTDYYGNSTFSTDYYTDTTEDHYQTDITIASQPDLTTQVITDTTETIEESTFDFSSISYENFSSDSTASFSTNLPDTTYSVDTETLFTTDTVVSDTSFTSDIGTENVTVSTAYEINSTLISVTEVPSNFTTEYEYFNDTTTAGDGGGEEPSDGDGGLPPGVIALLVVLLLFVLAGVGYFGYKELRKRWAIKEQNEYTQMLDNVTYSNTRDASEPITFETFLNSNN